jgi:hypothetical protein
MCNPVGSDTQGEWVKIVNQGSDSIDITGWKFNDGSNHTLNVPPANGGTGSMVLSGGGSAYLARDASEVSLEGTVIDTVMSLNNTEDALSLLNADGEVMSTYVYAGESAFTEGELCIGVGESSQNETPTITSDTTNTTSNTTTINEVTTYRTVEIEPPQDIHIRTIDDVSALVGSQVMVQAEVYNARGVVDQVQCIVSFGDGSQGRSCSDMHVYEYPGVYVVHISARQGLLVDTSQFIVTVAEPILSIALDDELRFVEMSNHGDVPVALSGWFIQIDYKRFPLPHHTILLPHTSLKVSARVLQIDMARYAKSVQLIDAFNRIVADSRLPYMEESREDDEVLPEEEQKGDSVPSEVALEGVSTEVPQHTITEEASVKPSLSVIGRSVPTASLQVRALATVAEAAVEVGAPAAAVLSVEQVKESSWRPRLSSTILPWVFGLILLCGLAIVPLFLRGKDTVVASQDIDAGVESFTIEEIK